MRLRQRRLLFLCLGMARRDGRGDVPVGAAALGGGGVEDMHRDFGARDGGDAEAHRIAHLPPAQHLLQVQRY